MLLGWMDCDAGKGIEHGGYSAACGAASPTSQVSQHRPIAVANRRATHSTIAQGRGAPNSPIQIPAVGFLVPRDGIKKPRADDDAKRCQK